MAATTTVPYQFSLRTSRSPEEILTELSSRGPAGIDVDERGPSYIVFHPRPRHHWTSDMAIGAGIAILVVVLLLTALTPVFIVLLPLALAPAIPFYLNAHRPVLAVSAVIDEDGAATRVTVHGQAGAELAAALDAYLAALPAALPAPAEAGAPAG